MSLPLDHEFYFAPPESMTDAEVMRATVAGMKRLTGLQVIGFDRACQECAEACRITNTGEPNDDDRSRIRWLLQSLGYERQWVSENGTGPMVHLWVREPWPFDLAAAASRGEPITWMVSA